MKAEELFERIFGREHPWEDEDSKENARENIDLDIPWAGKLEDTPEKPPLLEVLGESPELRVLNTFVDNPVFELTTEEIAEVSGLSLSRTEKVLGKLELWGLVDAEVSEGERCFSLRTSSDAVRHLVRFDSQLFESKGEVNHG